jgi:hypothetical protein
MISVNNSTMVLVNEVSETNSFSLGVYNIFGGSPGNTPVIAAQNLSAVSPARNTIPISQFVDGIATTSAQNGDTDVFVSYGTAGATGILEYDATTGLQVNSFSTSAVYEPRALTVSNGNVYIVSSEGRNYSPGYVSEYTETGSLVNADLISGLSNPDSIAIAGSNVNPPATVTPTSTVTTVASGASYQKGSVFTTVGGYGTSEALVGGINTSGTSQNVTLGSSQIVFRNLASDVVTVAGNAGSTFALQLNFDATAATLIKGGPSGMTLLWENPNAPAGTSPWENAVLGNTGTNTIIPADLDFQGSWAAFELQHGLTSTSDLTAYLGAYGVDTTTDTVWAVLDHNSSFGVGSLSDLPVAAPEPSTWVMLLGGVSGVFFFARSKRKVWESQS